MAAAREVLAIHSELYGELRKDLGVTSWRTRAGYPEGLESQRSPQPFGKGLMRRGQADRGAKPTVGSTDGSRERGRATDE
jgi:hypothetical protein